MGVIGKIKNIEHRNYKKFKNSKQYKSLKNIKFVRKLKLSMGKVLWKLFPHNPKLHDDPILQKLFILLVREFNPSCIVETGTFLGSSTSFIAKHFPNIKIYTSEINGNNYIKAKRNLAKYSNVTIVKGTSPQFLKNLIEKKLLGEKPLFFLDAHWLDDWPLEEELKIISVNLNKAVIIIDDFKVPDDPRYKFDKYGEKECSIEMVNKNISKKNEYNVLFPKYGYEVFRNINFHYDLVGYPIMMQNMNSFFNKFKDIRFVKEFFADKSKLIKPSNRF